MQWVFDGNVRTLRIHAPEGNNVMTQATPTISRPQHRYGLATSLLALAALPGCLGWIDVPPVKVEYPVATGLSVGPTKDQPAGSVMSGIPMVEGFSCNLPDRNYMERLVRDAAGDTVGGLVHLKRVNLESVSLDAIQGDFSTLTYLSLFYVTVGKEGIAPAHLGTAVAVSGFQGQVTLTPIEPVDLLGLMDGQWCGAILVIANGTVPEQSVVFDADASLSIEAEIGL